MWAGPKHCLAMTTQSRLVMWGEHDSAETEAAPKDSTAIPFHHINLLPVPVANIDSVDADSVVVSVSCGFDHTLIYTERQGAESSSKLYVWGKNSQGQLGMPKKTCKMAI